MVRSVTSRADNAGGSVDWLLIAEGPGVGSESDGVERV